MLGEYLLLIDESNEMDTKELCFSEKYSIAVALEWKRFSSSS